MHIPETYLATKINEGISIALF